MLGTIIRPGRPNWSYENYNPDAELQAEVASIRLPEETWVVIPNTDLYGVSDHGRVFSAGSHKVLKPAPNTWKHLSVVIVEQGRRTTRTVHSLVAQAFVPNPDGHPLIRHINDDKSNNTPTNLAWGTPMDNNADYERNLWFAIVAKSRRADLPFWARSMMTVDPQTWRPSGHRAPWPILMGPEPDLD